MIQDECESASHLEIFRENWQTYKKIIDENYMFHRQIYDDVKNVLNTHFAGRAIAILDLGCGDASKSADAFRDCQVDYYCGYDLSAPALEYARTNLADLSSKIDLFCSDMLNGLENSTDRFDLVFSGFSQHHLSTDHKTQFFRRAFSALKHDGLLILVDVMREEAQSRQHYLDAYLGFMCKNWRALSQTEIDRVCDHVRISDYPETLSALGEMASAAGFVKSDTINKYLWHQTCVFYKEA